MDFLSIEELPKLTWIIRSDGQLFDFFYEQGWYQVECSIEFTEKKTLTEWIELKEITASATITPKEDSKGKEQDCLQEIGLRFTAELTITLSQSSSSRGICNLEITAFTLLFLETTWSSSTKA